MKLRRAEPWLRSVDRIRKSLEKILAASGPREAYRLSLELGSLEDGSSGGEGAEAWNAARIDAVLASPSLHLAARRAVLRILEECFPLVPASDPKTLRLRFTPSGLRFVAGWQALVGSILAELVVRGRSLPAELADLPVPSHGRIEDGPGASWRDPEFSRDPEEAGDAFLRHFLLDLAVPLFDAACCRQAALPWLADRLKALAGWLGASPLTRLAHMRSLGAHPLIRRESWRAIGKLFRFGFLDAPLLLGRALADLERCSEERFADAWMDVLRDILIASVPLGKDGGRTASAIWNVLARSHEELGGLERTIGRILEASDGRHRLSTLCALAKSAGTDVETIDGWPPWEKDLLARAAAGFLTAKEPMNQPVER